MEDDPLSAQEARELVRVILEEGVVVFSRHAEAELRNDQLTPVDAMNVLRGGACDPPELENGSWRYRARTNRITVVFAFRNREKLVVVTAWRNR